MLKNKFTTWLGYCLLNLLCITPVLSQTITGVTFSPSEVCEGESISVSFVSSGTFNASNKFSVELSAADGTFGTKTVLSADAASPAAVIIPSGTAAGALYKIRVVSSNPVKGDTATVVLTVNAIPATPTLATTSVEYCIGAAAAVLPQAADRVWYTAQTGGTALATTFKPVTTSAGTVSYWAANKSGNCESDRVEYQVITKLVPAPVLAQTLIQYCIGDAAAVLPQAAGRVWYAAQTGGTALATTFKPVTTASGTTSYWAENSDGDCVSTRTELKIEVVSVTTPTLATTSVQYCIGAAAAVLPQAAGRVWYTAQTGGTALAATFKPVTTSAGTVSYWAANKSGSCESDRVEFKVIVNEVVAPTFSSALVNYCIGAAAAVLPQAAGRVWYTAQTGGTALAATFKPLTTAAGTTSYWAANQSGGCESARVEYKVNVLSTPAPTVANLSYCLGEETTQLTATGTALKWYTAATGGTGVSTAPIPASSPVGVKSYYVTQTLNGCEGPRAEIKVTIKAIPAKPVTVDLVPVCQETAVPNTKLIAAVTKANGATLNWYSALTGGTGSTTVPAISTTSDGLQEFFVSQSVSGCESARSTVKLDVKALPAAPVVVSPIDYCLEETAIALTAEKSPTNNTLNWYTVATGGTAMTTAPVPPTTAVGSKNSFVSQVQTYAITGGTLKCESKRSTITVITNALPATPTATDLVECQTKTVENITLTANTTAGNTLKWYETSTVTTGSSTAPVIDKSKVLQKSYFVTQVSAKNCESKVRKEVKVRIKLLPGAPGVATVEKCQFDTPEPLTASTVTGAALKWWGSNETGGSASNTPPTPVFEKGESSKYFVSQILEGCESDRAKIDVIVKTTPMPNVSQPTYTYCQNEQSTPLTAQGQRLTWYFGSQSGPNSFAPPTSNIGTVSYYVAQTGDNGCISPKSEIKVTVNPKPSSLISGSQSIELGQTADIKIEFTGGGPWEYLLSDDTQGVAETSPLILKKTPQETTSYSVKEVKNVCGLGTPNGTALVTVLIPAINTGNPAVANICADKSFTIPFQASAISVDTYEYKIQISKDTKDENFVSIPTTVARNTSDATGIIPDTTSGGDYYIRLIVESPYYEKPVKGSISQVTLTVRPLPVATVSGSKTILVGESSVIQVDFTGIGPWHFSMSDNNELQTTSISPYYKTVTPATTTTYTVLNVQNECGNGMAKGEARIQVDPILSNEPEPVASDWLKVFPVPVELNLTVQIEKSYLNGTVTISVVDMMGRPIRTQKTDNMVTEVDFAQLPGGIYFVKVENGDLKSMTKVLKY